MNIKIQDLTKVYPDGHKALKRLEPEYRTRHVRFTGA